MKENKQYLIEQFIKNAIIQGDATYKGDYKKGNKASNKLLKIIRIMKDDCEFAYGMLDELMYNNESNVRIWASGVALDIGYKVHEAEKILIQISETDELGILAFNAEMSLKVRK